MKSFFNYFNSLKFKLIGSTILVEIIMLSFLVWNSERLMESNLNEQLEHRIQQLKPVLNASFSGPLLQEDLITLKELSRQFINTEIYYIGIYNTFKERVIETGMPLHTKKSDADFGLVNKNVSNTTRLIGIPIIVSNQLVGYLKMEMDTLFIINALKTVRSQSLLIAAIEIFISIILLGLIGFALTKYLSTLTQAANQMSQGDLSVRVPVQTNDEIGATAAAFNLMATHIFEAQSKLLSRDNKISQLNEELESRVEQRTTELQVTNENLENSIQQLGDTQKQLVQSEKMAALGGLVAGISHEINTPIGVSLTAASHLAGKIKIYTQQYESNNLTREDFESLIKVSGNSSSLILANLERAAELIRSFKQIAVDQTSDEKRHFNLKKYLSEILLSLEPELKKYQPTIEINNDKDFEIESYPGAISQIFTNLVMNTLIHGFENMEKQQGHIQISISKTNEQTIINYHDNGKGIPTKQIKKIFDPFFTTKRNQGGSGLGMHIVYNLVTQTLGGQISCTSEEGKGTHFQLDLPNSDNQQQELTQA